MPIPSHSADGFVVDDAVVDNVSAASTTKYLSNEPPDLLPQHAPASTWTLVQVRRARILAISIVLFDAVAVPTNGNCHRK